MEIGIVRAMRALAQIRHPGIELEPLHNKTWSESYEHYPEISRHYLGYQIKGEKTSSAVMLVYKGDLERENK